MVGIAISTLNFGTWLYPPAYFNFQLMFAKLNNKLTVIKTQEGHKTVNLMTDFVTIL